jgi:Uma2 family endonuclease
MNLAILENPAVYKRTFPISIEAYHLLYEQGFISEKTELLEGVVVEKMPKDPIHSNIVTQLAYFLYDRLKGKFQVRQENPISTGFSEPEPDIAIVSVADYSFFHPNEALLVMEVANTSLAIDRSKSFIYAKANIPEYIIINLVNNTLEIYSSPVEGKYSITKILQKEDEFASLVIPEISFFLKNFLPETQA